MRINSRVNAFVKDLILIVVITRHDQVYPYFAESPTNSDKHSTPALIVCRSQMTESRESFGAFADDGKS